MKRNKRVYTDELFEIAFRFRETRLWKQMASDELIALKHENGQICYCSVMGGADPNVLGMAVYMGEQGLRLYMRATDSDLEDKVEQEERHLQMESIACFFENKDSVTEGNLPEIQSYCRKHDIKLRGRKAYPDFVRYRRMQIPGMVRDDGEKQLLLKALTACVRLAEALEAGEVSLLNQPGMAMLLEETDGALQLSPLPLPEFAPEPYPSPKLKNELLLKRLKKQQIKNSSWAVELRLFPELVLDEDKPWEDPIYCYLLSVVDIDQQIILAGELMPARDYTAEEAVNKLAEVIEMCGRPKEILVQNDRAQALVGEMACQLSIQVKRKREIPLLNDILDGMLAQSVYDDDELDDDVESVAREKIFQLLDDESMLRDLPYEMLMELSRLAAMQDIPQPLLGKLAAELKRRKHK